MSILCIRHGNIRRLQTTLRAPRQLTAVYSRSRVRPIRHGRGRQPRGLRGCVSSAFMDFLRPDVQRHERALHRTPAPCNGRQWPETGGNWISQICRILWLPKAAALSIDDH